MRLDRRHLIGGALLWGLTGCSARQTYYRLAAVPGRVAAINTPRLRVRRVVIPDYLDQNSIVKNGPAYQLNSFNNDVWAAPLAAMLQAALVEDLSQRLPAASVTGDGALAVGPGVSVEVDVQRFDFDQDGQLNLTAQLGVKSEAADSGWVTAKFQAFAAPGGTDAASVVAAMSGLWAQAADALVAMMN